MRRDHALEIIKKYITDEIVVAVYQTCFDWMEINSRDLNYVSVGAMGQASSHGLGLALARPDKKIIVFDGDGSLLMNLGSLVTIGHAAPENYHHFVFVNGVYEVNGSHPVPGNNRTDFAKMAIAAGYRHSEKFSDLDQLDANIGNFLTQTGPAIGIMNIVPGKSYPRDYDYIHGEEARRRFRLAIKAS